MRAIYIANDGTKFDDEWECENYEQEQRMSSLIILDDGLEKINNLDRAFFIKVTSSKAIEALDYEGAYLAKNKDIASWEIKDYAYIDEKGGYVPLDEYIAELESTLAYYKVAKKKLNEVR